MKENLQAGEALNRIISGGPIGRILSVAGVALALGMGSAGAETIVAETFPENTRDRQNPPESLAWYATVLDSLTIADGRMTLAGAENGPLTAAANFPLTTLEVGDQLILGFEVTAGGEMGTDHGLRFGVFSAGTSVAVEGEDLKVNVPGYVGAVKYARHTNGTGFAGTEIRARVPERQVPLISGMGQQKLVAGGFQRLESGLTYGFTLMVTRVSESEVSLQMDAVGGSGDGEMLSTTVTESAVIFHEFDTVAFSIDASGEEGGIPSAEFSNIRLEVIRAP